MARMVTTIKGSIADIALDRSQAQRYYNYGCGLLEKKDKVWFDDKLKDVIQPFIRPGFPFREKIEDLNGLICSDGTVFSRSLYDPGKIMEALEEFSVENFKSFRYNRNYQLALEQLRKEFSRAKLKMLSFSNDQDVLDALPKTSTHSGFLYLLNGKKLKGQNLEGSYLESERLASNAKSSGNFGVPILIAHRTQGSAHNEHTGEILDVGKHKTRLVCMVDMRQIVNELKYAKPLQNFISKCIPWYSGGKTPVELRNSIRSDFLSRKFWVSLDFSGFDHSLSDWLLEDAFSVIRAAFNECDEELFNIVCDSFIHKDFLLPGGKVKHSDRGVPSGSMFTQIVDSICNRLMLLTYLYAKCPYEVLHSRSHIMGDDHLLFTDVKIDYSDLSSYLKRNFGVTLNPDKCVDDSLGCKGPWFLSREFRCDGEWRHPNVLLDRMLFPERRRPYFENPDVSPMDVIYCMIQMYPLGMKELIDLSAFYRAYNPSERKKPLSKVDGAWLPGSYAYVRDYILPLAS